jgi:hypothetical protein
MSDTKHTPGPWEAVKWSCHAATTVVTGKIGPRVVICECSGHGRHTDESLANARLIAAAPELLDALERMVDVANWDEMLQSEEQHDAMIVKAEAAIRKAKGE